MENQLLFFISALGVFNGALMGLYFLFKKSSNHLRNRLFGIHLLMLSLRIGKSIFHYFSTVSKDVLQLGLTACLFIGIFLYLYIKLSLEERDKLFSKEKWQLYGLAFVAILLALFLPYRHFSSTWNPFVVIGLYLIWIFYLILSGFELRPLFKKLVDSNARVKTKERWLLVVFLLNVSICLVFYSTMYFGFPDYITGPITFSLAFYFLVIFLLFHPDRKSIVHGSQRYQNKKISLEQAEDLNNSLKNLIEENAWYKKSDLKLPQVAEELRVSSHLLSQYLNDNVGKTFSEFINKHRVDAACQIISSEHQFTLEGIGYEVGFRSKSNFYATFKKHMGCTPNQYKNTNGIHSN